MKKIVLLSIIGVSTFCLIFYITKNTFAEQNKDYDEVSQNIVKAAKIISSVGEGLEIIKVLVKEYEIKKPKEITIYKINDTPYFDDPNSVATNSYLREEPPPPNVNLPEKEWAVAVVCWQTELRNRREIPK